MIGNRCNWSGIDKQGRLLRLAILLLDVANLVDPLLHGRNLRFDSVTKEAKVCWNRGRRFLDEEWDTILEI